MMTQEELAELHMIVYDFAREMRTVALHLDQHPEAISDYLHLGGVQAMTYLMIPPEYAKHPPITLNSGRSCCGMSCMERVIALEAFGYGDCGMVLAAPGASLSGQVVLDMASDAQKEMYYSALLEKPTWTFFALTEPLKGSDATQIHSTMQKEEEGGLRINGEKYLIGNGTRAEIGVVFVRSNPGPLGMEAVLIDTSKPGYTAKHLPALGVHALQLSEIRFEDYQVSEERILARHLRPTQRGIWGAIQTFNKMRPGVAALALGLSQAVYDYILKNRKSFTEAEKAKLSALDYEVRSVRHIIRKAAGEIDRNPNNGALSSVAKVQAVKLAESITCEAFSFFGPGSMLEHPFLNKWYRDARAFEFMEGTSSIQKLNIAKSFLSGKIRYA